MITLVIDRTYKMKNNIIIKTLITSTIVSSIFWGAQAFAEGEPLTNLEVKGEITFFTNRTDLVEAGVYDRYTNEFRKMYPGVTSVKVIGFADYQGGVRPRMNTGDYGDVVLILPSVPSEQYGNFYEPLDMYNPDEIYFHDAWSNEGKMYGVSMGNVVEGLVYNKDVLAEAGVKTPLKTTSELYAASEKIANLNKIPFYVNFGAQWPLQQWDKYPIVLEGNSGVYEKMLTQDKAFFGDTAYHKSLSLLKTLIDKGWTEKDLITNSWEESKSILAEGNAGMFYLGNWFIPQVIDRGISSEKIGFMPIPAGESGELRAQMNHDWGYAVSKHSKSKPAAKAYIKFILEKSDFDELAGFIPTIKAKESTLPQLNEFMSYNPEIIQTPTNSSTFIEVTNRSQIDFYSGGYIQDVMTAPDFDNALKKLDGRWNRAKKRVIK